jgi:hypothetical protein
VEKPASPTLTAARAVTGAARVPQRRRRRPAVLALAVALVASGGLGGAALYLTTGQRVAVLALARDVPAGQQVEPADLVQVRISLDPSLKALSADSKVVGMRATTDLKQGTLLTASELSNEPLVGNGEQVVGVAAKRSQLPARPLTAGTWVVLVYTPSAGNGGSSGGGSGGGSAGAPALTSITARVVDLGDAATDGSRVVDLAVPAAKGQAVADLAAGGDFALLLAARSSG